MNVPPNTAPVPSGRSNHQQTIPKSAPSPGRRRRNVRKNDVSQDYSSERREAKMLMKSLHQREKLQGKLERVTRRLKKAEKALAKKTNKAAKQFRASSPTSPESKVFEREDYAKNGGLPSWRKPYLENYIFKTPAVTSLLSNGMAPAHQFMTEKQFVNRDSQIGNKDALELKRWQLVSDGRNGVVKSNNSKFAEQLIIFERMTKGPSLRERKHQEGNR